MLAINDMSVENKPNVNPIELFLRISYLKNFNVQLSLILKI
jgi:hypothetical protein